MTTLLVTGCTGFIGSNFCSLLENDFRLVGVDLLVRGSNPKNLPRSVAFHRKDIRSESDLREVFEARPEISGIINFAAETHVDHSLGDDGVFWSTNVLGVRNLARMALEKRIRLLHVSTDEVYGPSCDGTAFSEKDPLNPRNPYAASKAAGDLLLLSYHEAYGLNIVITRGSNTMGRRQSSEKVVPKAIRYFLANEPFPLYKTPARRLWLGVEDHCRAVLAAFQKGRSGGVYNVAPDMENEIETGALVREIRSLIGKGEIQLVKDRTAYDLRYLISSQKIRTELGWQPAQDLPNLIRETIRWYCDNPDWIETSSGGGVL